MPDKKKRKEEKRKTSSFTVLFTSLSVILLAFFILLNSMATIDDEKVRKALGSMLGSFGILPGGFLSEKGSDILPYTSPIMLKKTSFKDSMSDLEKYIIKSGWADDASVEESKQGVVITFADSLLFASGSANIDPRAFELVDKLHQLIISAKNDVRIEGHTDNVPIKTKRFPSNWELSAARAVNVLRYLLKRGGVSPDRLSAIGYGEYMPLVENDSGKNRAKNRRVSIVFIGKVEEAEDVKKNRS